MCPNYPQTYHILIHRFPIPKTHMTHLMITFNVCHWYPIFHINHNITIISGQHKRLTRYVNDSITGVSLCCACLENIMWRNAYLRFLLPGLHVFLSAGIGVSLAPRSSRSDSHDLFSALPILAIWNLLSIGTTHRRSITPSMHTKTVHKYYRFCVCSGCCSYLWCIHAIK